MGRVHFIGGEKGGVGKSLTARLLAQYLIDQGKPLTGFDSDRSHGSFSRFYHEFTSPLIIDDYDSLDGIIDAAEQNPEHDLIIDLAAQTAAPLERWLDESDVFGIFNDTGHQVFIWHVMDDGADSVQLLDKTLARYPQSDVQLVIVQNLGRGDSFAQFEQSSTYQAAQARNAYCVTLNKLQPRLMQKVDFNNFSFWTAANNREAMTTAERQRVRVWLKHSYQQFERFLQDNSNQPVL